MVSRVTDSFRYTFSKNLIPLYIAIIVGREVMTFPLPTVQPEFITTTITFLMYFLGLAIVIGGIVGILHQVVEDAV